MSMESDICKLHEKLNLFDVETKAIISQMDFMEESIILSAVRDNSNDYLSDILPNFKSIEDAQRNLDVVMEKLKNSIKDCL